MIKRLDPLLVEAYDYTLPEHLIASAPADPKDSARLLVYDRRSKTITHALFSKILDFLPPETAVILNDTKVIKARIFGHKKSGGKIELLINNPLPDNRFLVYIRGRVSIDSELLFDEGLEATVLALHEDGTRVVAFTLHGEKIDFETLASLLEKIGHIPLPPYIKRADNEDDQVDYQTLFAKNSGAVAAPTASLHFTPALLEKLQAHHESAFVTLHVGAGTFKPVECENITDHVMHKEFFFIPDKTKALLDSSKKILAVGTTVTRTIEYYARYAHTTGASDLFLHPHNPPIRVDHLLTNFHLPKSTLLMLVAGFVGLEKALELYQIAIEKQYRFYSYGDAMLIL